jgi:hypothetical protein
MRDKERRATCDRNLHRKMNERISKLLIINAVNMTGSY